MATPIYDALVAETGVEPRCPHTNTWTTRGRRGGCLNCGRCFHTVIVRENAGTSWESRFCDDCGQDFGRQGSRSGW